MAKSSKPKPKFKHGWYLPEWLDALNLKPGDMMKPHEEGGLGWSNSKASLVYNGHQGYTQSIVDDITAWLHLRPHELLMPPERAFAIRNLEHLARGIRNEPEPEPIAPQALRQVAEKKAKGAA